LSCATSVPDTFTAWLCQGGHFLCVVLHWRELSLCLRQPGGAKQHLSFAHFRVSKPGNYLVLLTCYSVFTSTVTEGFLVWLLLCCAFKLSMGYLIVFSVHTFVMNTAYEVMALHLKCHLWKRYMS